MEIFTRALTAALTTMMALISNISAPKVEAKTAAAPQTAVVARKVPSTAVPTVSAPAREMCLPTKGSRIVIVKTSKAATASKKAKLEVLFDPKASVGVVPWYAAADPQFAQMVEFEFDVR